MEIKSWLWICGLSLLFFSALTMASVAQEPAATTPDFAVEFGGLVGSEAECGLSFKSAAVEQAIRQNVAPGDLEFNGIFGAYVSLGDYSVSKMGSTEKRAHCTTAERNARALGLID
jgi:hypothetical protein